MYLFYIFKQQKKYKYYLKIPAPLSGFEAASMMLQREGYDCKFVICNINKMNPFIGNYYLPDKNIFVMKRILMDGKNLMAMAVGCQLAASALRYKDGDICRDISTVFEGEYALKYIYKKEELENLENNTQTLCV